MQGDPRAPLLRSFTPTPPLPLRPGQTLRLGDTHTHTHRHTHTHIHTHTHSTWPLYHFRLFTHFFCHFCPCPSFSCGCSGADRRFPTSRRASFSGALCARRQRGLPLNHPFS